MCLLWWLLNALILANAQYNKLETCILSSGGIGHCRNVTYCPEVIPVIKKGIHPQLCGFDKKNPIFCCKNPSPIQIKTTNDNDLTKEDVKNEELKQFNTISEQKCHEYYQDYLIKPTTISPDVLSSLSEFLGRLNITEEELNQPVYITVAGGEDALAQEFLHMAILGYGNGSNVQWQCGGSLISEKFVLTAAHCLFSREYGQVNIVRLGELRLDDNENDKVGVQELRIVKRIRHPDYKAAASYNDIALLELERPATINEYVRPACLNVEPSHGTAQLVATGWGKLSHFGDPAKHLQKVNLNHFPYDTCDGYFTNRKRLQNGIDDSTQVCAGDVGKDTCSGDSGGPLQIRNLNYTLGHRIIGVTSFGKPCAISAAPGVYTRVSAYIPWIESVVWPNEKLAA